MPKKRRVFDWNGKMDQYKKENTFVKNDGYSDNIFKPKLDDKGQYQAIIRFLPRPEDDGNEFPFVKLYNHGFKSVDGRWFIENCPTTLKEKCPVCKRNGEIWDADEPTAKKRGRRTSYFSNILIITDPQNKENEGEVFIFRYGKTIYDMLIDKVSPEAGSIDEQIHVYDYDEGLNFKLKIKPKKTGNCTYNDYSSSQFSDTKTPIAKTDKEIDEIDGKLHTLEQIVDPKKFKSYIELETDFFSKIGESTISKPEDGGAETSEPSNEPTSEEQDMVTDEEESPDSFFETLKQ